jgi:hypothetical protein
MLTAKQKGALNNMNPSAQFASLGTAINQAGALQAVNDIWFVDKNSSNATDATSHGSDWSEPFKTISYAVSQASDYDWIFVGQGVYSETATITISNTGLKIFGAGTSGYIYGPTSIKSDVSEDHMIKLEANGCEIAGIDFICEQDGKDGIRLGTTKSIYKTHIHDCHFGSSAGEYGIYIGDTYDAVDTHIEGCEFKDCVTAGIRLNGTRCKVTDCIFFVPGSGIGIDYVPDSASRPNSMILNNYMLGSDDSDTGFKISNTPTKGTFLLADNVISGFNTAITQTANNAYNTAQNYEGSAAGGALIDTVA